MNPQSAAPCHWKTVAVFQLLGPESGTKSALLHLSFMDLPLGHPVWTPLSSPSWYMSCVLVETFETPGGCCCCFTQLCPSLQYIYILVVVVFLSLKTDRELGVVVKECACSPLQLFWGCNPSGLGPDPHTFLYPLTLSSRSTEKFNSDSAAASAWINKAQSDFSESAPLPPPSPPLPSRASILSLPLLSALPSNLLLLDFPLAHLTLSFLIGFRSQTKLATRANWKQAGRKATDNSKWKGSSGGEKGLHVWTPCFFENIRGNFWPLQGWPLYNLQIRSSRTHQTALPPSLPTFACLFTWKTQTCILRTYQ